jgi:hypothetical protein
MLDHDPGRPHPSLVDLAAHRAAKPTIDPIQLHCRRPVWAPVTVSDPEAPQASTARTADMSGGIDQALEDADQQGYVRGHADGLEAAVFCERVDWFAMGAISGVIGAWVVRSVLPALIAGLDQLIGWVL